MKEDEKIASLKTATALLLNKYQHIITQNTHKNRLTIEQIVADIVQYYEDIINCMPGNVYWFDERATGIGCNQNVLDMFGLGSINEFKGLTFESMGKLRNWPALAEQSFKNDTLEVISTGKPKLNIEEPPIVHINGKTIYFLSSRVPLKDPMGNVIGVVGISIDITEIRKAREALKKEKEQAEALIKLQSMKEELRQAQDKLEGMTLVSASLAHELRTPLRTIHSAASGIKDYLPYLIKAYMLAAEKKLDVPEINLRHLQTLAKICDTIETETQAAFTFINMSLINIDQEIDKKDFDNYSIVECVQEAIKRYPFDEGENTLVHWSNQLDFTFYGNRLLIIHVLFNLLKNALYAIKDAGIGKISISTELSEDFYLLRFRDTAKGIASDVLPHIFERFFSRTYHGAGIGLTFCKMVMEKLGGKITCVSEEKSYTEFLLYFPVMTNL